MGIDALTHRDDGSKVAAPMSHVSISFQSLTEFCGHSDQLKLYQAVEA